MAKKRTKTLSPEIAPLIKKKRANDQIKDILDKFARYNAFHERNENWASQFEKRYAESDGAFVYDDSLILVEKVINRGINLGLLTGNMQRGAEIKLGKFDLIKHFEFGAFAEDGLTRNDLPEAAKRIAEKLYNVKYKYEDIVLVGDTPEDAIAATTNNCKSIIVCRRNEWYDEIVAAGADIIVKNLDDPIIEEKFLS